MNQKATARAQANIAFIKYWGNRNEDLRLPENSSLSMNLDGLFTETTVIWDDAQKTDSLILNNQSQTGQALENPQIISDAHNNREAAFDPAGHAELLAIRAASAKLGRWRLSHARPDRPRCREDQWPIVAHSRRPLS